MHGQNQETLRLLRRLEELGRALGISTGLFSITVHGGKASKLSIRKELSLLTKKPSSPQIAGPTARPKLPAPIDESKVVDFVVVHLESHICSRVGHYGHADAIMRGGKLKRVVLYTRANLAL